MRLSDMLSKPLTGRFEQVEGFLDNVKLKSGKQKRIKVGIVALNYFCKNCDSDLTFCSGDELFCIGIHDRLVSIDCALKCPRCGTTLPVWFLVESESEPNALAPKVRVLKRSEKLSEKVQLGRGQYGDYSELLEKAECAYRDELGAGAIVYLRKVFEGITVQTANALGVDYEKHEGGNPKNFFILLQKVDEESHIIPREFASDGYRLFRELSNVVHSTYDEQLGLQKYDALHRLVIGVLENVKNNQEMMAAIGSLGWYTEEGEAE
jgi:hypothetical protein